MWLGFSWAIVTLAAILGWVATTWIRTRQGSAGSKGTTSALDELRETLAAQESVIAKLEERVQVLERIVTDGSTSLGDEIERLRA